VKLLLSTLVYNMISTRLHVYIDGTIPNYLQWYNTIIHQPCQACKHVHTNSIGYIVTESKIKPIDIYGENNVKYINMNTIFAHLKDYIDYSCIIFFTNGIHGVKEDISVWNIFSRFRNLSIQNFIIAHMAHTKYERDCITFENVFRYNLTKTKLKRCQIVKTDPICVSHVLTSHHVNFERYLQCIHEFASGNSPYSEEDLISDFEYLSPEEQYNVLQTLKDYDSRTNTAL